MLICLLIWISSAGFVFIRDTNENSFLDSQEELMIAAETNANSVEDLFDKYANLLTMSTYFLGNVGENEDYFKEILNDLTVIEDFEKIGVVFPDGESFVTKDGELIQAAYQFTEKMETKESFATEVYFDENAQKEAVAVNVPLLDDQGKVEVYFIGVLTTEKISEVFNKTLNLAGGYYHVIDSNGRYVAASDSQQMLAMDTLFHEAILELDYESGYDAAQIEADFKNREEGTTRYKVGEEERVACYKAIEINNWVMYDVVPYEVIKEEANLELKNGTVLFINIILIFITLLIWVYRTQTELTKYAAENEKNLRFLSGQMKEFIMEWDFILKKVKITGNFKEVFGREENVRIIEIKEFEQFFHSDDVDKGMEIFERLRKGEKISDVKLRLKHDTKEYIWCNFAGVPIKEGKKQNIIKGIGFMKDIDHQEKENEKLKRMSEIDLLTGVYNKGTIEHKIEKIIKNSNKEKNEHVLIIIDLDNFKTINDTFGHQFGDEVLKEFAKYLKTSFRKNDIIGRIGGDEFFVFMKETTSGKMVTKKCENVCKAFDKKYEDKDKNVEVSVSIGVAEYPLNGEDFDTLYKKSDIALYNAKKNGKNTFKFYNEVNDDGKEYVSYRTDIDSTE